MDKKRHQIELVDSFLKGETSPEEEVLLKEWFNGDSVEEDLHDYYKKRWEDTEEKILPIEVQGRMYHRIMSKKESLPIKSAKRHIFFTYWSRVAAIILLASTISLTVYYKYSLNSMADKSVVVMADNGQRSSMILPDGTKVWLNSDTELKYSTDYGQATRSVSLSGEAYFEVAKDPGHRFIVNVGDMHVEALGTVFNIKAYEDDDEITTTLYEGKVKTQRGTQSYILKPNQSICFNTKENTFKLSDQDASYNKMWMQNELVFKSETLGEIAVIMKRLYNVDVVFALEEIKYYRFSGVIRNNSLDNVFELISLTSPILYEKRDSKVILSKRK